MSCGQQPAAEAVHDAGHDRADLAGADDAHRAAVKVEAQQAFEREVALAHAVGGAVDLAIERQHQADGVLAHGIGRIGRHADHGDAQLGGGGQVDVVEARAAQGDQPRAAGGQLVEHAAVERSWTNTQTASKPAASGTVSAVSRGAKNTSSCPEPANAGSRNSRSYRGVLKTAIRMLPYFLAPQGWSAPCLADKG